MHPRRRGTFGIGLGGVRTASVRLAIGLVAGSVIYALGRSSFGAALLLSPADVAGRLWLWQPLTYGFIEASAPGVLFGALILWQTGGGLEQSWGPRRLTVFAVSTTVLAGVLTTLLATVVPQLAAIRFPGGWVMASEVWVAYGLSLGRQQTGFWFVPVSGNVLALIGAGFVFLDGAFSDWLLIVPAALGLGFTLLYVRGGRPEMLWLRFQSWRLQRRLRGRTKHLHVVAPDRNTPRDSDRYLH